MVTERFLKLPEEKRMTILDAARDEFARVPFEEASINQIIKNAGISRGSFYTYFEDKGDVLDFLFQDQERMLRESIKSVLLECKGDYWAFLQCWLERVLSYGETDIIKKSIAVFRMSGFRYISRQFGHIQDERNREHHEAIQKEMDDWLYEHVDAKTVDLSRKREEIDLLFHHTIFNACSTLLRTWLCDSEDAKARSCEEFRLYIDLMRNGAGARCPE